MKIVILLLVIISILCGCSPLPETYPFKDQNDSIESIELLYHPSPEGDFTLADYVLVRELAFDEIDPFMDALHTIKTKKTTMSPVRDYGVYVVRVTYVDGEIEIFGNYHIEFVESGEYETGVGFYFFVGDKFKELFLEYAGELNHLIKE